MSPSNRLHKKIKFSARSRFIRYSYLVALLLVIFSCKEKEDPKTQDLSEGFSAVYDTVNKIFDRKKPDQAIHYLDSAFKHLSNTNSNDKFRFYSVHFLYNRNARPNLRKELLYADSMFSLAQKNIHSQSYVANMAEANFAKGDVYFDLKQYDNAYNCFYQGNVLGKSTLDNAVLAEYTYRMGMIMFKQSHFDRAVDYFKESLRQSLAKKKGFKTFYLQQELLNDIGESYQANKETDSAIVYFNKTLDFINQHNDQFKPINYMLDVARAVTYGDLGSIYYNKKQYQLAADQYKKSIAINLKKYNDNYNAELVEINLGKLYLDQRQDSPFIALMQDMHRQFDTIKNIEAETGWNKLMSDYYNQKNDPVNAFQYFRKYSSLKDSLVQQSLSLKESDVSEQLSNYDKQYQIQNLRNDNKLQRIYLYVAILCAVMAVIIILLVYRNWTRSKRDVDIVSKLNQQINLQKTDLETTLKELKTSSEEKDRILRTVAHDLRNPIGAIVSLTNSMLEDDYNEEQKMLLKLVNGTSFNSLELINEILEATHTTNTGLNKQMVDINSLVNNSVEILSFKAAEKHQHIITELLASPAELLISQEKIWRVISNLISNAIKFSPKNAYIKVKVANEGNDIKISVSDSGIGIPDPIKDEVFNIFTNAKRPGTDGEKSFGLGLSICQQIISDHNGKIWFEGNNDIGTTFYVTLPAIIT